MSIVKKINQLTTIQESTLNKINDILYYIYSNDIIEQLLENPSGPIELELFEGSLYLYLEDDTVKYKFIPNNAFESVLIESITKKKNLLAEKLSDKLKSRLITIYKDIF